MNSKDFYLYVRKMRCLQNEYKRTMSANVKIECERIEAIIDAEILRVDKLHFTNPSTFQLDMFEGKI